MAAQEQVTPSKAAIRLTHLLDVAFDESSRFPVDVASIATEVGSQFNLNDEITVVEAANLDNFEGGLFRLEPGRWAMLYNEQLESPGRVRFTQAHELGHFFVHRLLQDQFQCSQSDVAGYEARPPQI